MARMSLISARLDAEPEVQAGIVGHMGGELKTTHLTSGTSGRRAVRIDGPAGLDIDECLSLVASLPQTSTCLNIDACRNLCGCWIRRA